jgi:carboxyl-terminal processing protease
MKYRTLVLLVLILLIGFSPYAAENPDKPAGNPADRDKPATDKPETVKPVKDDPIARQLEKVRSIHKLIKENYVSEPNDDKLFEDAFKGMVGGLDPYSEYFTADDYKDFMVTTRGEFGGVGMEISLDDGILTVVTPVEDSPAFRAGILPGDRILEIDGEPTDGMNVSDSIKLVRGKPGTQVVLTVLHKGSVNTEKITVTREIIKLKSIKATRIVDDKHKIGYIRISDFKEETFQAFDNAVDKLEEQGMKALIIDLRFNPGGLLESALRLSNRFVKEGALISIRGRNKDDVRTIPADKDEGLLSALPLAILLNGSSASASEVFSGCMQDHKRAAIVGSRSYGKGSVQQLFPLKENGPAVKMTIARYYTPSGRSVDRSADKKNYGVLPDYVVELTPEQEADLIKSWQKQRIIIPPNPSEKETDHPAPEAEAEEKEFVDIQLNKAVEVLIGQDDSEDK